MKYRIKKAVNKKLTTYFPQFQIKNKWKNFVWRNGEVFFFTEEEADKWLRKISPAYKKAQSEAK